MLAYFMKKHYKIIIIDCIMIGVGHFFAQGLINFFYSTTIYGNLKGIFLLIKYSIITGKKKTD